MLPSEEFRAAFLGDNLLPYHELVRASLEGEDEGSAERALQGVERARARALADALDSSERDDASADPAQRENARLRRQLNDCYRMLARPGDNDEAAAGSIRRAASKPRCSKPVGAVPSAARGRAGDGPGGARHGGAARRAGRPQRAGRVFLDRRHVACLSSLPMAASTRCACRRGWRRGRRRSSNCVSDRQPAPGAARLAHRLPELRQRALHHCSNCTPRSGRRWRRCWVPRRAVVVPHGALHYLPFEALHDGHHHEVERRELCRVPSAAVLLRCLARPPLPWQTALVLGHADERLPQVHAEVEAVTARFPSARMLHDAAATGAALHTAAAPTCCTSPVMPNSATTARAFRRCTWPTARSPCATRPGCA